MKLNINKKLLKLFYTDLWKDFRQLEVISVNGDKAIRRYSDNQTSIQDEYQFIKELKKKASFKIPNIISHTDNYLLFQYVPGTRAFNLLMDLKVLYEQEKNKEYFSIGTQIMQLLQDDLKEFQSFYEGNYAEETHLDLYPAFEKTKNVFFLLTSMLGLQMSVDELDKIISIYLSNSDTPFRDATPKNVILDIPLLNQKNFNSRNERLDVVKEQVKSGELKRKIIRDIVYHIDFSGCSFRCPKKDDWITISQHEASVWLKEHNQKRNVGESDEELCTKFVRFSRLGGRKLAYRLLNNSGYQIRFGLDNEAYYFYQLSDICKTLVKRGIISDPSVSDVMLQLVKACNYTPPEDYFHSHKMVKNDTTIYYSDVFPN